MIIEGETKDLNRQIHNQKLASEILQMPYGEGSSNSKNEEIFRVYYSSFLNKTVTMAGIGVVICDSKDEMIFELRKHLDLSECDLVRRRSVEEQVLIEALNAAIALDLKRIVFYCDNYPLYQFVSGQWRPKQQKIIDFLDQVNLLRKNFTYCEPSLIARKDVKFAFKLAREAISSEISNVASSPEKLENCVICLDDKSVDQFFSSEGCAHQFCYSCIKQHVEVKLLNGVLPKCPHEGCGNLLRFESCENFLNPKFTDMMRQQVKEESIPVTEKVYCPYPKCSALMSKTEVLKLPRMINEVGAVTCYKCHGNFCINCRVPWHNDMNCAEYKRRNPALIVEESKLKSLAARNLWRQCIKCQHMIELAAGCYHMTCRCGYEFCYTCGAEWKNKKATCTCPLWHEENILDIEEEEDGDVDFEHNFVLQNDNFGHNVVLEDDDDFGHNIVMEDDDFGQNVLEDDDFGGDVVPEDDGFGHNVVLEDDGFGHNVVLEDDGFGHNVVLEDDVFEDDGFGHNVVLEDDVFEDDGFGRNVILKDDVFEDDDFGHDVVFEGDDFEDDNVHENDDFVEEVLLDDVHENDNFEDEVFLEDDDVHVNDDFEDEVFLEDDDVHVNDDFEDEVLEDDVLEEEQEQEDGGNDFQDDVYDDFGGDVDVYDDYGGDEDVYDDFGDDGDVYDDDYYF